MSLCLCAVTGRSVETVSFFGSFIKLVSLTSTGNSETEREHVPLSAVGEVRYFFLFSPDSFSS